MGWRESPDMIRALFTTVNFIPHCASLFAVEKERARPSDLAQVEVTEGFEPPMRVVSSPTLLHVKAL